MREIQLTQSKMALVDDEDFDFLNKWKWFAYKGGHTFYAGRGIYENGKKTGFLPMHRFLLQTDDKNICVDHIDHNGLNNQKSNLRGINRTQNQMNRLSLTGSSIYKGVSFDKGSKKFRAYIRVNKRLKHLGFFESEKDAAIEYNKNALYHFGEFSSLNAVQ